MTSTWVARRGRVALHRLVPRLGPRVDGVGVALDLYPWFVEAELDTVVPVQNYFSAFFPDVDTATVGHVDVRDEAGRVLVRHELAVAADATPLVRLSELVGGDRSQPRLGTVTWHLEPPAVVRDRVLATDDSFFFWDRSYIGYEAADGRFAFIHGVDKTELVAPNGRRRPWPGPKGERFTASPELPVSFDDYDRLDVVLVNRNRRPATMGVRLVDRVGATIERTVHLAGLGVAAEPLRAADVTSLDTAAPLRLEVDGLPTRYGRPIAMKRFPDGAVSLMHC